MQKTILILIIAIVVIAVVLGVYFIMTSFTTNSNSVTTQNSTSNQTTVSNTSGQNTFMIQGMKVEILKQGSGTAVKMGDNLVVDYVGKFADGKVFDSSLARKIPFPFTLSDSDHLIKGWNLGMVGMKVGEQRKLTIPPELAYGPDGFLSIPKNATLTFEVTLLKLTPGK